MVKSVVEFSVVEKIPPRTFLFQIEDGTIFYRDSKYGDRLFVKWEDREFERKIPCLVTSDICAFGNALYFKSEELEAKIYKAEFTPFGGIDISYVRDVLEDERAESDGLMSRVINGKKYVYRLADDPLVCGGVLVDGNHEGIVIRRVHRGKSVNLLDAPNGTQLSARKLEGGNILIEGPRSSELKLHSIDSSRFLYFVHYNKLHVLDADTLEFLPTVELTGIHSITAIIGVHEGVMTVTGKKDSADCIMITQLPRGCY